MALAPSVARPVEIDMAKLREQLIRHEGLREKVYKDSEGIPTVGVGFNLNRPDAKAKIEALGLDYAKVKASQQTLDRVQIDRLLDDDIGSAIASCKVVFPEFDRLSDVRQRVLADMMFNLGKGRFGGFKNMIARVKAGDFAGAADEMKASKWYTQVKGRGKTLEGMMRTDRDPR